MENTHWQWELLGWLESTGIQRGRYYESSAPFSEKHSLSYSVQLCMGLPQEQGQLLKGLSARKRWTLPLQWPMTMFENTGSSILELAFYLGILAFSPLLPVIQCHTSHCVGIWVNSVMPFDLAFLLNLSETTTFKTTCQTISWMDK